MYSMTMSAQASQIGYLQDLNTPESLSHRGQLTYGRPTQVLLMKWAPLRKRFRVAQQTSRDLLLLPLSGQALREVALARHAVGRKLRFHKHRSHRFKLQRVDRHLQWIHTRISNEWSVLHLHWALVHQLEAVKVVATLHHPEPVAPILEEALVVRILQEVLVDQALPEVIILHPSSVLVQLSHSQVQKLWWKAWEGVVSSHEVVSLMIHNRSR